MQTEIAHEFKGAWETITPDRECQCADLAVQTEGHHHANAVSIDTSFQWEAQEVPQEEAAVVEVADILYDPNVNKLVEGIVKRCLKFNISDASTHAPDSQEAETAQEPCVRCGGPNDLGDLCACCYDILCNLPTTSSALPPRSSFHYPS